MSTFLGSNGVNRDVSVSDQKKNKRKPSICKDLRLKFETISPEKPKEKKGVLN